MFSRDIWKEIFEAIGKNKLRTFLTGFTVALGIFIFVTLFGMGNGLNNTFDSFFGEDANNVIIMEATQTSLPYGGYKAKRRIHFDNDDLADIEKDFAPMLDYLTPRISRRNLVTYGKNSDFYYTRGVAPGHLKAENSLMMRGRYINNMDLAEKTKYAVIGRMVEIDLFDGEDAMGQIIDVDGSAFKVVGVFQDEGGDNEERYIYIPYTTRQLLEGNEDEFDDLIVAFKEELGHEGALRFQDQLLTYLRQRKVISPKDRRGFNVINLADELKKNQQFAGALQIIISAIAFAVIISGIIGISNIMLFVVKERTKEIGIRKALGATPKNITNTIMLESIFITAIFGFLGMLIGVVVLRAITGETLEEGYFITKPGINIGLAVFVTILLVVCGAIAAFVPARRAAKIKPIVALRDE
ncbi:MAG: ABC transporter permease [Bacteroidota bacterium]